MNTTTLVNSFRTSIMGLGLLATALVANPATVNAESQVGVFAIPVSTIVRNIGEGNTKELASNEVQEQYVGMTCSVEATAENQSSVHPGNDLVVASGTSQVVLEDVERESNVGTSANGELTLGETVTVSLVMGEDDVFSAGMDVVLTCENEIEVCRDGEIVTIKESERVETDTDTCPTPEEPKQVQVCRDDKIITVNEDEVLDSDLEGSCPETLGTQTLPVTGLGVIVTSLLAGTTLVSAAYGAIKNRQ